MSRQQVPPEGEVAQVHPDLIVRNDDNPRLIFPQSEMQALQESIEEVGILVPLTVFEKENEKYTLVDGERRWLCALRLNLKAIPVNIIARPASKVEYVLRMFNIHNVREDWKLMPTALKLKVILEAFPDKSDKELAKITGMTVSTLQRCKELLKLPLEYQSMILEEEEKEVKKPKYSEDFFLEMMGAIRSIKKFHANIYQQHSDEGIIKKFVEKRENGKIKNETDFRKIPKVIAAGRKGVSDVKVEKTIARVIDDEDYTIDDAYKIAVPTIESVGVEKQCTQLIDSLNDLDARLNQQRKQNLASLLKELRKIIDSTLRKIE
ncbi:MAG: ParB/RepB/Spo0J family partition protein [Candidatus Bathyarchaeota archaeon]|nr:ParB/RepB/Spo0J family partition protein [Candidatus Bathyarchaeota archaeon]